MSAPTHPGAHLSREEREAVQAGIDKVKAKRDAWLNAGARAHRCGPDSGCDDTCAEAKPALTTKDIEKLAENLGAHDPICSRTPTYARVAIRGFVAKDPKTGEKRIVAPTSKAMEGLRAELVSRLGLAVEVTENEA